MGLLPAHGVSMTVQMYCDQCAMSLPGGCTKYGVCGKDPILQSLQEALIYGLRGMSAYYYHAQEMGYHDKEIEEFLAFAMYTTLTNVNFNKDHFLNFILELGKYHIKTMELLDRAYVETFGKPQVVEVPTDWVPKHGIIVTGHSYKALYELLKQIREMGVEDEVVVYTHSEMLPAHSYPKLKEFKSLYGNLGKSWWDQRQLFSEFPGVAIGTSNCVVPPLPKYADRMYTVSVAGLEGVKHVEGYDFTEAIKQALSLPKLPEKKSDLKLLTGFHHTNVPYDVLVDLIKEGKISKVFVVGGCDLPNPKMSYYTKLVKMLPKDTIVLTAGCGKFRFNDLDLGKIEGVPRLIDFGQCNNVYSILAVAQELAKRFGVSDLNDLPVRIVLSWMEQKAVAILFSLLYLGLKGIYIGPVPPRFLKDELWKAIAEQYDLKLITEPEKDLKALLA